MISISRRLEALRKRVSAAASSTRTTSSFGGDDSHSATEGGDAQAGEDWLLDTQLGEGSERDSSDGTAAQRAKHALFAPNGEGRTPMHVAGSSRRLLDMCYLVSAHRCQTSAAKQRPSSSQAARRGLAGHGVNARDNAGWTPLHEAVSVGDLSMVTALLLQGANVNSQGYNNETPLHTAAMQGSALVVSRLLLHGADTRMVTRDGQHPRAFASNEVVRKLIDAHHDQVLSEEEPRKGRRSAVSAGRQGISLREAVEYGLCDHVEKLLTAKETGGQQKGPHAHGADVNAVVDPQRGLTLLHFAVIGGFYSITDCLLAKGASANCESSTRDTPLHYAVGGQFTSIVELLMISGANPLAFNEDGICPWELASQAEDSFIMDVIREWAPSVERELADHIKARQKLKRVSKGQNKAAIKVQRHGKLNDASHGASEAFAMDTASDDHHDEDDGSKMGKSGRLQPQRLTAVKMPSSSTAHGDDFDAEKWTAAYDGYQQRPRRSRSRKQATPFGNFHNTVRDGSVAEVEASLIANLDSINAPGTHGRTPLHLAVQRGKADVVELLLMNGADPSSVDARGNTPLHVAARRGNAPIIRQLLKSGALPDAENAQGVKCSEISSRKDIRAAFAQLSNRSGQQASTHSSLPPRSSPQRGSASKSRQSKLPSSSSSSSSSSAAARGLDHQADAINASVARLHTTAKRSWRKRRHPTEPIAPSVPVADWGKVGFVGDEVDFVEGFTFHSVRMAEHPRATLMDAYDLPNMIADIDGLVIAASTTGFLSHTK